MEKYDNSKFEKLVSSYESDSRKTLIAALDSYGLKNEKIEEARARIEKIYKESNKPVVELTFNFNIENNELFLKSIKINETAKRIKKEEAAEVVEEAAVKASKTAKRKRG